MALPVTMFSGVGVVEYWSIGRTEIPNHHYQDFSVQISEVSLSQPET
jgi:hypothetical protein